MEAAAKPSSCGQPSSCGAPLLVTTNDLGHGSTAGSFLFCIPGRATTSPFSDSEQQAPGEERTTTVNWGRPELDRRRGRRPAQDQHELSASPVPWTVMTGTTRSSRTSWTRSTARSSSAPSMIPQRTSRSSKPM